MHTEHLNNVRLGYVLGGWAISIAATSLFVFVLIATGLQAEGGDGRWIALAVALGFAAGGLFVGFMTALAPILHGIMIGLTSLVAWAIVNVLSSIFFPDFMWTALNAQWTVAVILVQIVSAVLGARFGYRYAVVRT
ncbi:MAG TPA: hypothetical protein VK864_02810 [Longimicrobiales bacterium]|nr:hypothetical protein [Longimicrobiales bacterium]